MPAKKKVKRKYTKRSPAWNTKAPEEFQQQMPEQDLVNEDTIPASPSTDPLLQDALMILGATVETINLIVRAHRYNS